MTTKWRSKLGNEYDMSVITRDEARTKRELDRLRNLPENRLCADCGQGPTVWASVDHGVFLCIRCGSHHRGIGTHISKPKGCTGTYLWGPDEINQMKIIGNERAKGIYGGDKDRPGTIASDAAWRKYLVDKYENKVFAPTTEQSPDLQLSRQSFDFDFSTMSNIPRGCASPEPDLIDFVTKPEPDLMQFGTKQVSPPRPSFKKQTGNPEDGDFFAQFGL